MGDTHTRNEDAFVLLDHPAKTGNVTDRGCVFAVSDGVSTVAEGHWASQLTVASLSQFFDAHTAASTTAMAALLSEVDWEIRGERAGRAACTAAVVWVNAGVAHIFQVGDSHVFLVRHGVASCLTQGLDEGGRKLKHFLGMGPAVSEVIQTAEQAVESGDALILVTDGVTEHLDIDGVGLLWARSSGDPAAFTEAVLGTVARHRGADDATVIAAMVL